MKLVIAVVSDTYAPGLVEKLINKGVAVTRLASSGGFLRRGNSTLLIGVEDDEVQVVIQTVKDFTEKKKLERLEDTNSKKKDINEGLATIFILPIEKILHF